MRVFCDIEINSFLYELDIDVISLVSELEKNSFCFYADKVL